MKKINYEYPKLNEFKEEACGYFSGIDTMITELNKEHDDLTNELAELNAESGYDVKSIKRKATIENELIVIERALEKAQSERNEMQETYFSKISQASNYLSTEYKRFIEAQLKDEEEAIRDLMNQIETKISELKEARQEMTKHYHRTVSGPIDKVVGPHFRSKAAVLGINQCTSNTRSLKDRVDYPMVR
ncbi:hypothetical protein [Enterococcus sp. AZ102]|uniref:hypothetical protein n=1 Tax=Enterococcus sp. AZ102 TaxID=2774865 RepID=UPI003F23DCBA